MTFRYQDVGHRFDDELVEELKLAEGTGLRYDGEAPRQDSGLKRIAERRTPLDAVKAVVAEKTKTSEAVIREHVVRERLEKIAAAPRRVVTEFLESLKD